MFALGQGVIDDLLAGRPGAECVELVADAVVEWSVALFHESVGEEQ